MAGAAGGVAAGLPVHRAGGGASGLVGILAVEPAGGGGGRVAERGAGRGSADVGPGEAAHAGGGQGEGGAGGPCQVRCLPVHGIRHGEGACCRHFGGAGEGGGWDVPDGGDIFAGQPGDQLRETPGFHAGDAGYGGDRDRRPESP